MKKKQLIKKNVRKSAGIPSAVAIKKQKLPASGKFMSPQPNLRLY